MDGGRDGGKRGGREGGRGERREGGRELLPLDNLLHVICNCWSCFDQLSGAGWNCTNGTQRLLLLTQLRNRLNHCIHAVSWIVFKLILWDSLWYYWFWFCMWITWTCLCYPNSHSLSWTLIWNLCGHQLLKCIVVFKPPLYLFITISDFCLLVLISTLHILSY